MASLLICTPCYGKLVGEGYLQSLLVSIDLLRSKGHQVKVHTIGNESLITRARNNQVAFFLSTKFDKMIFIDADITWPAAALLELTESDQDVCGIPYPTKSINWTKAIAFAKNKITDNNEIKANEMANAALNYTLNKAHSDDKAEDGWLEVKALGTGFFMMKRSVLEKMRDHYRDALNYKNDVTGYLKMVPEEHCVGLFETMIEPESRRYLSEDYAFCKRWIDIGGKINACIKYKLIHSGTADF